MLIVTNQKSDTAALHDNEASWKCEVD